MLSESKARSVRGHISRWSIAILTAIAMFSCGKEPDEPKPPEGLSDVEVTEKSVDCYISNGGTQIYSDYLGPVRLIANSPCKKVFGLSVERMPGVESLWFLEGIESSRSVVFISGNPQLQSLDGLQSLSRTNELEVRDNASLRSLTGLSGLEYVRPSEDPLSLPSQTPGNITLKNNPELCSLDGLENLKEATSIVISNCSSLRSIEAIDGLDRLDGLTILNSPVPRCQIDEFIAGLDSEPEYLDIGNVGSGSCD